MISFLSSGSQTPYRSLGRWEAITDLTIAEAKSSIWLCGTDCRSIRV